MHRLFLDANVLFSAAYLPNAGLLALWRLRNVTLCSSRYALEEARINLEDDKQRVRLVDLLEGIHLFEAAAGKLPRGITLPDKDIPIMLGALAAHATHLLTGDARHFGPYVGKKIEGVIVVRPGDYLRRRGR